MTTFGPYGVSDSKKVEFFFVKHFGVLILGYTLHTRLNGVKKVQIDPKLKVTEFEKVCYKIYLHTLGYLINMIIIQLIWF